MSRSSRNTRETCGAVLKAARRLKPARGQAFGILNPYGEFWTYMAFESERDALDHIRRFWGSDAQARKVGPFKVIPVKVTVSAK